MKLNLRLLLPALLFLLGNFQNASAYTEPKLEEIAARYEARYFNDGNGNSLPYRLFKPANYDPLVAYPLVIFLHGSGERGSDNMIQLKNTAAGAFSDSLLVQKDHPCFVIAPQCPNGSNWGANSWPSLASMALIKTIQAEFNIDLDRTYITGLSMGAIGTWSVLGKDLSPFAAAVPVSGGPGSTNDAGKLISFPIWAFHGTGDNVVAFSTTSNMINAINNAGGNAMLTALNTGHDAWIYAYIDPYLIDWLFSQVRKKPFVPDTKIVSTVKTLNLFVNETAVLFFNISPDDASNKHYINWSSSNPGVASVSYTGLVRGASEGSTNIILTTQKGNTDTCRVQVTYVSITGVTLNPISADLVVNSSLQIVASITPVNASNQSIFWESSNKAVASVNSSTGLVKGVSAGKATIKSTTKNGLKTATCEINVVDPYTSSQNQAIATSSVQVSPNPATDYLTVSNVLPETIVSVFTQDGKLVYKTKKSGKGELILQVNDWEKGIYIIYLQNKSKTIIEKVVIQ